MTTIAERRDELAAARRQHERDRGGDRRRERRAGARARAAADHAAARQHDVREPARDARRPRRAGGRVQAGDQGPGAVPARAAPAGGRRAADDPRPAPGRPPLRPRQRPRRRHAQDAGAAARRHARLPQRPPGAQCAPSRCSSSCGPYTPDLIGWLRDFGQGAANYDANGHYARIQPIFNAFQFTDNPAGGLLTPIPPANRMDGLRDRRASAAARAPPRSRRRTARPRSPKAARLDCDPSLVLPGP